MRFDLYQAETAQVTKEQSSLLDEARLQLQAGGRLSRLEENGVLHALQILIENAIGKANSESERRARASLCMRRTGSTIEGG